MDLTQASEKWKELIERIERLEAMAHPCKELHEFDVWPELNERIEQLEAGMKELAEALRESGHLK